PILNATSPHLDLQIDRSLGQEQARKSRQITTGNPLTPRIECLERFHGRYTCGTCWPIPQYSSRTLPSKPIQVRNTAVELCIRSHPTDLLLHLHCQMYRIAAKDVL